MAHFHYTIMGGLVFAFFAGIYYWLPKMAGVELNETLAKVHFWGMFVVFNSTFLPLFAVGMLGMPRRVVTYPPHLQWLNDWVSISAFLLGGSMLVFLANLVWSQLIGRIPAGPNPWSARRTRVAAADTRAGGELRRRCRRSSPGRTSTAIPGAAGDGLGAAGPGGGGLTR